MPKPLGSYARFVCLLTVVLLNMAVMAQTNIMDSTPSKTDIIPKEELLKKLGAITAPATPSTTSSLPFPVDSSYPKLYVIPANQRPIILDQGSCGACVAFTTSTVLATMLYRQTNVLNALGLGSNANSLIPDPVLLFANAGRHCTEEFPRDPKYAWHNDLATAYFAQHDVAMRSGPLALPLLTIRAGKQGRIDKNTQLPAGLTKFDAMRKFIATQGALASQISVFASFNRYKTGIYNHQKFNSQIIQFRDTFFPSLSGANLIKELNKEIGGHAVTIVGYFIGGKVKFGDLLSAFGLPNTGSFTNELDLPAFWVVQNSWGKNWGINGLVMIEANQPDIGIDDTVYFMMDPIVKKNGVVVK